MKKPKESDELRPAYARENLGKGTRGKYLTSYNKSTNLVLISPDVAEVFPTQEAVNDALRSLIRLAQKSTRTAPAQARRRKKIPVVSGTKLDLMLAMPPPVSKVGSTPIRSR